LEIPIDDVPPVYWSSETEGGNISRLKDVFSYQNILLSFNLCSAVGEAFGDGICMCQAELAGATSRVEDDDGSWSGVIDWLVRSMRGCHVGM